MMSLWDALRMNMMISYQELVRTFLSGYHDTNAICPYTSIGNVVNNGHRPDSIAYYTIQTVAHTP